MAYLTIEDATDPHAWSGFIHAIYRTMQQAELEVVPYSNLHNRRLTRGRTGAIKAFHRRNTHNDYFRNRDRGYPKDIARDAERRMRGKVFDAIVAPEKLRFVRYGANLPELPTAEAVEAIIAARRLDGPIRLIMVGGDWVRKGGPQAVAVARTLRARGIPVELRMVGAKLPEGLPDYVIGHGYVRKDDPKSWARFRALMEQAHFSILPTRAECCAVVLAEAVTFAVPALATRVGGNEAAVLEGETGYLFALDADPGDYCDKIEALITAPEAYAALCHSAYRAFHAELTWAKAGEQSAQLIRGLSTPQNPARP